MVVISDRETPLVRTSHLPDIWFETVQRFLTLRAYVRCFYAGNRPGDFLFPCLTSCTVERPHLPCPGALLGQQGFSRQCEVRRKLLRQRFNNRLTLASSGVLPGIHGDHSVSW